MTGLERRVQLRALELAPSLLPPPQFSHTFEPGPVPGSMLSEPVGLLSLTLSFLPEAEQRAALQTMFTAAPLLLVADWQLPERNLEAPASFAMRLLLENLARAKYGAPGLLAFKHYRADGALEGLLYREQGGLKTLGYRAFWGGALALALLTAD